VTYPDPSVVEIISDKYIPVQLDVQADIKRVDQFQVLWTPNLNVVDDRERVFFHLEGWLPPMEFTAMLHCGEGHFSLHRKNFEHAVDAFQRIADNYPQSEFAPQALYYAAVGRYLGTHDADRLMSDWKHLQQCYPTSAWAYRTRV
jgi:hypothetical protein